jgi:DUF2934 family protein
MTNPKIFKQPRAGTLSAFESAPELTVAMRDTLPSEETNRIRDRAYQLYEVRGRGPGRDEQDWLCAEREILKRQS